MPHTLNKPSTLPITTGVADLLRLAGPLMLGQFAVLGMTVTDIYMAGQIDSDTIAALQLGGSVWSFVSLVVIGIMIGNSPIIGNYWGAGLLDRVRFQFQQGLWLAVPIGVLVCLAILACINLLSYLDISETVYSIARAYLLPFLLTGLMFPAFFAFRSGLEGMGDTRPMMIFNCLAFVLNGIFDYIFMFGKLGFPAMGGAGAAWATVLVMLFLLTSMALYARYAPNLRHLVLYKHFSRPIGSAIGKILALGIPIALTMSVDMSFFAIIPLMIAHLGSDVLGAHAIAINLDALVFMLPLGIGQALTIRVAHAQGAKNPRGARLICLTGFKLVFVIALILGAVKILMGGHLANLFSPNTEVATIATTLFLFSALMGLFDCLQISCSCALRGFKDTRVPLAIQITAFWLIAFPVAYTVALTDHLGPPLGVFGFWLGAIVAAIIASISLLIRWHRVTGSAITAIGPE
jgi:MATE family multidrug resistance protein